MSETMLHPLGLAPGRMSVIVPVFAADLAGALDQAAALGDTAADLAELRLDPLRLPGGGLPDGAWLCDAVRRVRGALDPRLPLLVTVRTAAEGGERLLEQGDYPALLGALLAAADAFDGLDVQYRTAGDAMADLCRRAGQAGVAVVASQHDFHKTPPEAEMVQALCGMHRAGADVCKLAVMPRTAADAAALLFATARARDLLPGVPLITMSMGALGAVTRVCGGAFGSWGTFGTAGVSSAPGQPDAAALRRALDALGACLA